MLCLCSLVLVSPQIRWFAPRSNILKREQDMRLFQVLCALAAVAPAAAHGLGKNVWKRMALLRHQLNSGSHLHSAAPTNATTHFYASAVLDHSAGVGSPAVYWKQRFYVDDTFWGGDDYPIFLYIGGEGPQGERGRLPVLFILTHYKTIHVWSIK